MRIRLLYCIILVVLFFNAYSKCNGRFVNPITDICWSCLFPISIGGINVVSGVDDTQNPKQFICKCGKPIPKIGIPISFWEPIRLVDVTRKKLCLVNMGGVQIGSDSIKGHGTVNNSCISGRKNSFYQVHYYVYPILHWLELFTDFVCVEHAEFDIAYITEIDPLWNDDETAFILNPETSIFAHPSAQASCAADCISSISGLPIDSMFWCAGCHGSIYPFTGNVPDHISGVQASLLLVTRMLAKLHRELIAEGTMGVEGLCGKYSMPIMSKTQYKQQMLYPVSITGKGGCKPLGRSDLLWGSGKEKPYSGEDFGYLIWRKRNCCLF